MDGVVEATSLSEAAAAVAAAHGRTVPISPPLSPPPLMGAEAEVGPLQLPVPMHASSSYTGSRKRQVGPTFIGAPHRPRVTRICHVHVTRLDVVKQLNKAVTYMAVGARIRGQKLKSQLRSQPIAVVPELEQQSIALDVWFSMEYLHRMKGESSVVQLVLDKRKKKSKYYRLQGDLDIPLDLVFQCPVNGVLSLWHRPSKMQARLGNVEVARIEVEIYTELAGDGLTRSAMSQQGHEQLEEDELEDDEDISSDDLASEYESDGSIEEPWTVSMELNRAQGKKASESKLKPRLMSKINNVKMQGTRFIDKLKSGLRKPKSGFSSQEEEEAPKATDERETNELAVEMRDEAEEPSELDDNADDSEMKDIEWPAITEQIDSLGSGAAPFPRLLLFVDRRARQSRQLMGWALRAGMATSSLVSPQTLFCFADEEDVSLSFFGMVEHFKRAQRSYRGEADREIPTFRIAIAGDDSSISLLLRAFVQLLAREPRAWDSFKLFVVPLDININHVSQLLADIDSKYRSIFLSSRWTGALDGSSSLINAVGGTIDESLSTYAFTASQALFLPIGEALLEIESATVGSATGLQRVSVPFFRDVEIVGLEGQHGIEEYAMHTVISHDQGSWPPSVAAHSPHNQNSPELRGNSAVSELVQAPANASEELSRNLVVEYWVVKKGKVRKHAVKGSIRGVYVDRLGGFRRPPEPADDAQKQNGASSLQVGSSREATLADATFSWTSPPHDSLRMTLLILPKDKLKFLSRFGAYSPKKLARSPDVRRGMIDLYVTKVVVAVPSGSFSVRLDGIVIPNVRFLSLSPQFSSRIKALPIATFERTH